MSEEKNEEKLGKNWEKIGKNSTFLSQATNISTTQVNQWVKDYEKSENNLIRSVEILTESANTTKDQYVQSRVASKDMRTIEPWGESFFVLSL